MANSEEKSILDDAAVDPYDQDTLWSFGNNALIDGSFKTVQVTNSGATIEMKIDLAKAETIVTVFVLNAGYDNNDSRREDINESFIWIGSNSGNMTKNPAAIRDSGFFKIEPMLSG